MRKPRRYSTLLAAGAPHNFEVAGKSSTLSLDPPKTRIVHDHRTAANLLRLKE